MRRSSTPLQLDAEPRRSAMRTRTMIWMTALSCVVALVAVVTASGARSGDGGNVQERFLYVSTIAQSKSDPDFIAVIGADARRPDFGRIVNRIDMPNVGDE